MLFNFTRRKSSFRPDSKNRESVNTLKTICYLGCLVMCLSWIGCKEDKKTISPEEIAIAIQGFTINSVDLDAVEGAGSIPESILILNTNYVESPQDKDVNVTLDIPGLETLSIRWLINDEEQSCHDFSCNFAISDVGIHRITLSVDGHPDVQKIVKIVSASGEGSAGSGTDSDDDITLEESSESNNPVIKSDAKSTTDEPVAYKGGSKSPYSEPATEPKKENKQAMTPAATSTPATDNKSTAAKTEPKKTEPKKTTTSPTTTTVAKNETPPASKPTSKPATTTESKVENKAATTAAKTEPKKTEPVKAEPVKTEPKKETKVETKPETKVAAKAETKTTAKPAAFTNENKIEGAAMTDVCTSAKWVESAKVTLKPSKDAELVACYVVADKSGKIDIELYKAGSRVAKMSNRTVNAGRSQISLSSLDYTLEQGASYELRINAKSDIKLADLGPCKASGGGSILNPSYSSNVSVFKLQFNY